MLRLMLRSVKACPVFVIYLPIQTLDPHIINT